MKRQKMTQLAAALVVVAAGVAVAGTVAAQAGPAAEGRPDPAPQAVAAPHAVAHLAGNDLPACATATICAFSGPNATGTEFSFPTSANHSQWINFSNVSQPSGTPFHPDSIINNSGSDIWVYDASGGLVAGPYCALGTSLQAYTFSDWQPVNGGTAPPPPSPSPGYTPAPYQPGWFFINFNVNTCAGPVSTPLP
jgi:hypothetical protein